MYRVTTVAGKVYEVTDEDHDKIFNQSRGRQGNFPVKVAGGNVVLYVLSIDSAERFEPDEEPSEVPEEPEAGKCKCGGDLELRKKDTGSGWMIHPQCVKCGKRGLRVKNDSVDDIEALPPIKE